MRYQFTPQARASATTIVFANQRVSFVPGIAELDDTVWSDIKDDPTIADMLETEVLRVLTPPADTASSTTKTTKKADTAAS